MDLIGSLVSGAMSLFGGAFSAKGQEQANQQNADLAQQQMAFQAQQVQGIESWETQMSNTAHQREVADLKAAGLNPILSANSGASTPGVSVPSGAMATMKNPYEAIPGSVNNAVNSALSVLATKASIDNTNANTAKTVAETADPKLKADQISNLRKMWSRTNAFIHWGAQQINNAAEMYTGTDAE